MKRILSLALAVALIVVLAVPVKAADSNASGWIELLEYNSVNSDGSNIFTVSGTSGSFSIPVDGNKRLRKVDILLWNPSGQRFTSASATSGSTTMTLDVLAIGSNMTRIVGYVPNANYSSITILVNKSTSSTQSYEVLSFKATPVGTQEFVCDAKVYHDNSVYNISTLIEFDGVTYPEHGASSEIFGVAINDWRKYDSISIWGSATGMSIDSMRASIYTAGLPITVNFIQYNDAGSWTEYVFETDPSHDYALESGASMSTPYYGKYLFNVIIDLSGTDRSLPDSLFFYLTGHYDTGYGMTFNCQYVNGQVYTADTSGVSWWNKFAGYMSDLMGEDEGQESVDKLDEGSASISQGASDIGSFEQSQQDTLNSGFATISSGISFASFSAALLFVQKYTNMTFNGISKYAIVFTLPLFLGLFFYLCSRIPGVTRWKSRPPQSKGGGSP